MSIGKVEGSAAAQVLWAWVMHGGTSRKNFPSLIGKYFHSHLIEQIRQRKKPCCFTPSSNFLIIRTAKLTPTSGSFLTVLAATKCNDFWSLSKERVDVFEDGLLSPTFRQQSHPEVARLRQHLSNLPSPPQPISTLAIRTERLNDNSDNVAAVAEAHLEDPGTTSVQASAHLPVGRRADENLELPEPPQPTTATPVEDKSPIWSETVKRFEGGRKGPIQAIEGAARRDS